MIKEAIDKVITLAKPNFHTALGLEFSDKPLHMLKVPTPDKLELTTLTGLVDAIKNKVYETDPMDPTISDVDPVIHVVDPWTVRVYPSAMDKFGDRHTLIEANYPTKHVRGFTFGNFMDPERFTIAARTGFQSIKIDGQENDLDYVLKIAAGIIAKREATSTDDGLTQTVETRGGVSLKGTTAIKPLVNLAPWRTFAEIDQPVSQFLLRARGEEQPELALFEADGGRWALDAVKAINDWLSDRVDDVPVIA